MTLRFTSVSILINREHVALFRAADVDYRRRRFATCSLVNDIKVYAFSDVGTSPLILLDELKDHEGAVWQVSWSHYKFGNLLASCGSDGKVFIWKEENMKFVKQYEYADHNDSVNTVLFAPKEYGLVLACGSSDSCISFLTYNRETRVWDAQKITNAHRNGCNCLSWAPPTTPMTSNPTKFVKRLTSGGNDSLVKIWTEVEGMWVEQNKLEGHSAAVTDVTWDPSEGVVHRHTIASCSKDKTVIIWSSDNLTDWISIVLATFRFPPLNVTFAPIENILTVSEGNRKISFWHEHAAGNWRKFKSISAPHGELSYLIEISKATSCS